MSSSQTSTPALAKWAAIAVGTYQEVVLYITGDAACRDDVNNPQSAFLSAAFRPDATTPFGATGQSPLHGGRLRVDGTDLTLALHSGLETPAGNSGISCSGSLNWVIAGVN